MDKISKKQRSEIMRRVRQKNTAPELAVRKILHALGYRFRLHSRKIPGSPDIVLPKYHSVIFVHGCFWHGHDCRKGALPKTRKDFWERKIEGNKIRDAKVYRDLKKLGYRVLVVWGCEVNNREKLETRLMKFLPKEEHVG